jgi:hypothetical protein
VTSAAYHRPEITVRPMIPASETDYVMATSIDAIVQSYGGRFAARAHIASMVRQIVERSSVEVATTPEVPDVILGFTLWQGAARPRDRMLEMLYLRKSLAEAPAPGEPLEPLKLAKEVLSALLGPDRFIRMRRTLPQRWAWNTLHAAGYAPMVMPEAI